MHKNTVTTTAHLVDGIKLAASLTPALRNSSWRKYRQLETTTDNDNDNDTLREGAPTRMVSQLALSGMSDGAITP